MKRRKEHYKAPGIYSERVAHWPFAYELVPTGIPAFVGSTSRGPLNKPQRVRTLGQFHDIFGHSADKGYMWDSVRGFFENGGKEAFVVSIAHHQGDDEVKPKDYLGQDLGPDDRTGIQSLSVVDDVDLICVPDLFYHLDASRNFKSLDDAAAVQRAVVDFCENMGDRIAILDSPGGMSFDAIQEYRKQFDTSYAAIYYPWVQHFDRDRGKRALPPSGHIAGQYAYFDHVEGVHRVAANKEIEGVIGVDIDVNRREQELLDPLGINCVRAFPGRGTRVWGAKTLSSASNWRHINVRRIFNVVEKVLEQQTEWAVFEPNDRMLWKTLSRGVSLFLEGLWKKGYLVGDSSEEAFYVKCDDETNPGDQRDAGMLVVEVGLAPVLPAEFIVLRIRHHSASDTEVLEE